MDVPQFQSYVNQYMKDCLKVLGYDDIEPRHMKIIAAARPGPGYKLIYRDPTVLIYKKEKFNSFKFYIKHLEEY